MNCEGDIKNIKQGKVMKMIAGICLMINLECKGKVLQEMEII